MMPETDLSATAAIFGGPPEESQAPSTRAYRTRKSFAVVHFEPAGRGRIVFLPEGAEVRVVGPSRVCECFEVAFENQLYNIFKVDLLGPWASPIKASRIKPARALAMGACA
jgi:hypothetical protein